MDGWMALYADLNSVTALWRGVPTYLPTQVWIAHKLLSQVRILSLPFHRWYGWLETRFLDLRVAHVKEQYEKEILKKK